MNKKPTCPQHIRHLNPPRLSCSEFPPSNFADYLLTKRVSGYTRLDLVVTLCVLVLVTCCCLPMLANTRLRSERIVCVANLQAIGRAFTQWSAEHENRYQFWVDTNRGGVRLHPLSPNAWFQYAALSNELSNPRVLACPSDTPTRAALEFSGNPNGGFYHPTYRNNALSYFIGLHASPFSPRSLLGGDRNVPYNGFNAGCSVTATSGNIGIYFLSMTNTPSPWNEGNHGPQSGNLLFASGEVIEASSVDLNQAVLLSEAGRNSIHAMLPR